MIRREIDKYVPLLRAFADSDSVMARLHEKGSIPADVWERYQDARQKYGIVNKQGIIL